MNIELHNVTKTYGTLLALDNLSLEIESGAKVALIGPNGSGKSTLIRALMGMVQCEGTIRVDGCDPGRDRSCIARQAAYVPQAMPQFSFTIAEMIAAIALIRGLAPEAIEFCAHRLGLDVRAVWNKPVKQLSGGMKQKLMLALALAPKTRLLILDEPTASLDSDTRARFYELIAERAGYTTLILSSHRLDEVRRLVTHFVMLDGGRIHQRGLVEDFIGSEAAKMLESKERDHVAA